jgi:hypothetical protein
MRSGAFTANADGKRDGQTRLKHHNRLRGIFINTKLPFSVVLQNLLVRLLHELDGGANLTGLP